MPIEIGDYVEIDRGYNNGIKGPQLVINVLKICGSVLALFDNDYLINTKHLRRVEVASWRSMMENET